MTSINEYDPNLEFSWSYSYYFPGQGYSNNIFNVAPTFFTGITNDVIFQSGSTANISSFSMERVYSNFSNRVIGAQTTGGSPVYSDQSEAGAIELGSWYTGSNQKSSDNLAASTAAMLDQLSSPVVRLNITLDGIHPSVALHKWGVGQYSRADIRAEGTDFELFQGSVRVVKRTVNYSRGQWNTKAELVDSSLWGIA